MFLGSPPPIKKWHLSAQAPHRDIHEESERPEPLQSFPETLQDNLLPVGREFPVFVKRGPFSGIGEIDVLEILGLSCVAENPGFYLRRYVHPPFETRGAMVDLRHLLWFYLFSLFSHTDSFTPS
jgi:hypothetical protein